ncbi:MAG TPA: SDR family NAD(P)-dependent oxidoreductase, partial [Planctomycetota bacterium]|nr:SDR family NAD(P)-dependent oxidoreductase [Planctomycetota bacterium]
MDLKSKVCLVTGGTKGIGAAAAIALAEQGALVSIAARTIDDEARKTRSRIEALGRKCLLLAADVAKS